MSFLVSVVFWLFCLMKCGCNNSILFITDVSIQKYDFSTNISVPISDKPLHYVNDIAYDYELQTVYYVIDSIHLYSISMITKEKKLLMSSNNEILRIVVDWVTKKIYYTVATRNRVAVIDNTGMMNKVLFQRKMASLNAICLSPKNGLLFFSDMGDNAKIERANMDGTNNKILVSAAIQMPTTLTVDPNKDIIYWADVMKETVEMINMDGTGRKVLLSIPNGIWGTISSLAVFNRKVFMSTSGNADTNIQSGIFTCNKTNSYLLGNCSKEITGRLFYSSVKAFGNHYQRKINSKCRYKNGGCSHFCLLTPNGQGFSCGCPTGYQLLADEKTCSHAFEKFILFATRPDLRVVSLDVKSKVDLILPVEILQTVKAVDYDPIDKMIYWTDATSINYGVIMRASLNGSIKEEVVPQGYTSPDHLAIDWVARNLYWTCPRYHKIYISRLNGSSNMAVIDKDLEEPRGIAVDPGDGRLYWSDWGTTNPKIESSDLDGSNRIVLINESLRWPNGVALDYIRRHLYWVDAGTDLIEYYDLTKGRRHKLEYASPHAYGISVLGDMLYWTDWQQRALFQLDLIKRKVDKIIYNVHDIMGMKAIDSKLKYGNNECGRNNFGCSHFCFHKPNQGAYCACPLGHYLSLQNNKECIAVAGYLLYATWSSINMLSINPNKNSATPKILDRHISLITTVSKTKRVFWVQDSVEGPAAIAIKSASLNHTKSKEIVQTGFSGHVGGIAIDWLSENIYWSQSKLHRIEVSKLDGSYKRVIVHSNGAKIGKVVADPIRGKLYWLQTKDDKFHSLVRANLDGSASFILANFSETPFGLTVDINDSRVFWLTEKYIESVLWNGKSNQRMSVKLSHPSSMVLFQDYLFICELENPNHVTLTISSVHKVTGKKKLINHMQTSWCGDISVFHSALQQGDNLCNEDNGKCEHLCFPTNITSRRCACESHYKLDPSNNSSCLAPNSFLLISQKDNAFRYSPSEQSNVALNLKSCTPNLGMTRFNIMTNTLYWLDFSKKQILIMSEHNTPQPLNLCKPNAQPTSFTIDFFSNTMYWTDASDSTISFLRLNYTKHESSKCGIIFKTQNFQPTKITSVPERGQLFFIKERSNVIQDKTNPSNTLRSIHMDGSKETQLHDFKDNAKYDISIDPWKGRIYWLHLVKMSIESISLDGSDIQAQEFIQFNKDEVKPLAITILGAHIYWIDKQQKYNPVEYLKWRTLENDRQIYSKEWEYESTKDLEAVEMTRANKNHPCSFQNGECSHICYSKSMSPITQSCGCPIGFGFKKESKTQCEKLNNDTCAFICNGFCKPFNVRCHELSTCYEKQQKCSGCKEDDYKCLSGLCIIPLDQYCDGKPDCFNSLDEDVEACKAYRIKTTLMTSISQATTKYFVQNATHGYSEYTAGIVSGCILTAFVFACVFYVACRLRQKKAAANAKNESVAFREAASFNISTHNKESVFVLPPNRTEDADSAYTDSYVSSTDLTHLPRHNNESIQTFGMRYITGSSTNVTDSNIILPFNPPPTIASSDAVSLSSLNDYQVPGIAMSEMSVDFLPAPPATPLYCPSDMESVMLTDLDSVSRKGCQQEKICRDCSRQQHQSSGYKRHNHTNSQTCYCDDTASMSTVSTYQNNLDRRLSSSNCSYCGNCSNNGYHAVGRHKPPASYHPPSLVSEESSYSSRTLPRYSRQDSSRPLVPSLASGVSRCSSETSIVTVKHRDDISTYSGRQNDTDNDYYTNYGPPLLSDNEFPPEMNNFEDFKDEEDEALENHLLLESHRPPPGTVD